MTSYYLRVDGWHDEMVVRSKINMEIIHLAEKLGVDFAFPSQSLYVESPYQVKTKHSIERLRVKPPPLNLERARTPSERQQKPQRSLLDTRCRCSLSSLQPIGGL